MKDTKKTETDFDKGRRYELLFSCIDLSIRSLEEVRRAVIFINMLRKLPESYRGGESEEDVKARLTKERETFDKSLPDVKQEYEMTIRLQNEHYANQPERLNEERQRLEDLIREFKKAHSRLCGYFAYEHE